ncbi:hypothetical protein L211DRAFT_839514 [Terfezia boudieri ATCC MYA-4762]|uniref:Uncharacterized protein n=1 Tax=Terfezia boudieri ATCC MYA-4762 TaxID=1051890 RepID=A0A3N4LHV3_9PEZI|nr:hypothetical protein L211DRAFT_839514 [Terfezia boudieri ATCC MYA-4762]
MAKNGRQRLVILIGRGWLFAKKGPVFGILLFFSGINPILSHDERAPKDSISSTTCSQT